MFCVVVVVNVMWDICYDLKLYICCMQGVYKHLGWPLLGITTSLEKKRKVS